MALNYKPLWIQLIKKDLMKVDVIRMAGLTTNVMAQMGKNRATISRSFVKKFVSYGINSFIFETTLKAMVFVRRN